MIHKTIIKHAKRAHAHIQDHWHKWLWLLSGVFFFILIYPYFSNAQEPNDLCPNIDGIQDIMPQGQELVNGECVAIQEVLITIPLTWTITYSPSTSTTEIVVATVTWFSTTDVTVTSIGGETHTFTENGAFIFTFENTDGATGSETATVDWITTVPEPIVTTITGTITYSPSTSTTGTVVATMTWFSSAGVTVTSTGWATHTFTGNGSHTFAFGNTDGATGSATATVSWITPVIVQTQECEVEIQTPASGDMVSQEFDIIWSNNDCDEDEEVSIQLRDQNSQWILIGTGMLEDEEFVFNSTWLASTGFYTITGMHLSGTTYSGVTYTQDTIYNLYTGAYTGIYTSFATGYKARIIDTNQTVLAISNGTFTIDNQKPILTSLTGSFAPVLSWYVGRAWIMTASFVANKQLTGGTTFTILGTNVTATSVVQNGNTYSYTVPLSTVVASGALVFTANVTDMAGNTGALYGTSSIILKNYIPNIGNLTLTWWTSGAVLLRWTTDVSTKHNFSLFKSGTTTITYFTWTQYGTSHTYTMTSIQNNNAYPFTITVSDNLSNARGLSGVLHVSTTGAISMTFPQSDIAVYLPWQVEASIYLQILQNEINKFKTCKAAITFTNITIPIGTKSIVIKRPTITTSSVNQVMWAFLVLFVNKAKEKTTLSQVELNVVADAINNFLVIIKLVDDDEGNCEQKMSTYYLSQFEQLMTSMDFF